MRSTEKSQAQTKKEQHFTPVTFSYEGKTINFKDQKGSVLLNATQMGKAFGKTPKDWLRLQSTEQFLNALKNSRKADVPNELFDEGEKPLVNVIRGGKNQGTWMQEDVALEYSRWLNPLFAIWTNKHIKELLLKGSTAIVKENKGYPPLPPKRNHNRLTTTRLIDIMSDVVRIEDKEIRLRLTHKLGL